MGGHINGMQASPAARPGQGPRRADADHSPAPAGQAARPGRAWTATLSLVFAFAAACLLGQDVLAQTVLRPMPRPADLSQPPIAQIPTDPRPTAPAQAAPLPPDHSPRAAQAKTVPPAVSPSAAQASTASRGTMQPAPSTPGQAADAAAPATKPIAAARPDEGARGPVTNLPLPRYVTLKTSEGNARRGPGITHRIDWVFTRPGMPLRITAEFENWRRVEDAEGAGGWVHYSLLSGSRSVLVRADQAALRSDPGPDGTLVARLEAGVIARLLACVPAQCRVQIEGWRGWVEKGLLWGVDPQEVFE